MKVKFLHVIVISEIKEVSGNDTLYKAKLCYKIDLLDTTWANGSTGYIDARSGEVLKTLRRYNDFSETGTFYTLYNTNPVTAGTDSHDNGFRLYDSSRGAVIHTWNLGNTPVANYQNSNEFFDGDNIWTTAEHFMDHDQMALDVHWALQEIYDYFYNNYSLSSFDNNNHEINAYVHAVLTGNWPRDNSAWDPASESLFFGDGQYYFNPVASLDAVSHEYAHAITYNFTNLHDTGGVERAMNEGLSDIWGAIIEHAIAPDKDCWKLGEEYIIVPDHDCVRNIETPESDTAFRIMADTYEDPVYNDASANA